MKILDITGKTPDPFLIPYVCWSNAFTIFTVKDLRNKKSLKKKEIIKLDKQMIKLISGNFEYDYHEIAEREGYSKETHCWYWLPIEPEVKKYADAA